MLLPSSRQAHLAPPWPLTAPLVDVTLVFLALPFLWVLGLEQLAPILLLMMALFKVILIRRRVYVPLTVIIAIFFLGWQLLSATSIDRGSNWIVFGRNLLSYLAGFALYFLIVNEVGTERQFRRVLGALFFFAALATIVGVLFVLGLLPERFTALSAPLFPGVLRSSTFIQENVIVREIGRPGAVLGGLTYRRVSSLFLYPTTMAVAYLILLPLQFYAWRQARGARRIALLNLFMLSLAVFLFTATRTALLVLPAAVATILAQRWPIWRRLPRLALPALAILLLIMLLFAFWLGTESLRSVSQDFFVETRADSFTGRMQVYQATLRSLDDHWLLGWGTPRRIPQVHLAPAGTHGEFINILYSFGLVGFLLYGMLYLSLWLDLLAGLRSAAMDRAPAPDARQFLWYVAVILLALNVNGLAHGINFDLLTVLLFWGVMGLAHAAPRLEYDTENHHGILGARPASDRSNSDPGRSGSSPDNPSASPANSELH